MEALEKENIMNILLGNIMNKLTLSIIMPSLNEEKNIALSMQNALNALTDCGIEGELICINDGSSDNTLEIMKNKQKEDKRVRIVIHDKPKGFGASFWAGVMESKMDAVVIMPGDNENDPWEILRYFSLLEQVDMVIPFVFNVKVRSAFRRFVSSFYRLIINITFGVTLNYMNGTVLYRTSILRKIAHQNSGFFFQTDLLIRLIKGGYLFAEVPYRLEQREKGISKAVTFPSLIGVMKGYLRLLKDLPGLAVQAFPSESVTASRRSIENEKYKN